MMMAGLIGLCSMAQALTYQGIFSGDWSDGASWNQAGTIPDIDPRAKINIRSNVVITVTGTQQAGTLAIGDSLATDGGTLVVDGGTVTFTTNGVTDFDWNAIGYSTGGNVDIINGGVMNTFARLDLGCIKKGFDLTTPRFCTLDVNSGGLLNIGNGNLNVGHYVLSVTEDADSVATVTIDGGTINVLNGALTFGTVGTNTINIVNGGVLNLKGDVTASVAAWISTGNITGDSLSYSYDSLLDKTIVVPEPATASLMAFAGLIAFAVRRHFCK